MEEDLKTLVDDIGNPDRAEIELADDQERKTREMIQEKPEDELPLFIKVDRYESLLSIIDEIKHLSSVMNEVTVVLHQIDQLRKKAEESLERVRDDINERLAEIDRMLIRPADYTRKSYEAREIEETLSQLKREIEELRKGLGD